MIHTDGFIIKETPHNMPIRAWSALDLNAFIKTVNECVGRRDASDFNLETAEGCDDWLSHDLRGYARYSYADFLAGDVDLDCPALRKHAIYLNWIEDER